MIKLHYITPAGQSLSLANTLMQPLRGILAKDGSDSPKTPTLGPNPRPKNLNAQRSQSPQDPIVYGGYIDNGKEHRNNYKSQKPMPKGRIQGSPTRSCNSQRNLGNMVHELGHALGNIAEPFMLQACGESMVTT